MVEVGEVKGRVVIRIHVPIAFLYIVQYTVPLGGYVRKRVGIRF